MNKRQLLALGVPQECVKDAIACIKTAKLARVPGARNPAELIKSILANPAAYSADPYYHPFVQALVADQDVADAIGDAGEPVVFRQWGDDIDTKTRDQMRDACALPIARAGALMPDAHVGYGLPIGGVLATENAIVPYAVGVDIACRMKLSITDLPVKRLKKEPESFDRSLYEGTRFGVGSKWSKPKKHPVLDADWNSLAHTRALKDLAREQLGTSGSGNHFVEWGLLTLPQADLGLEPGTYVALLSHSGSRGPGAKTCDHYSRVAAQRLPKKYEAMKNLAWLSMDSEEGQEYFQAMNLMGEFASANHAVIHEGVCELAGGRVLAGVENHHNFCWKETHGGKELYVHRKGATPAGKGVLGVIPGSMADSCFVVRGKGEPSSLDSASHGAGRKMSRTDAKKRFRWSDWKARLAQKDVRLLAAGIDEVPGVYKDIHEVMEAQSDLVEVVAEFTPKVVLMCGDNSRAED